MRRVSFEFFYRCNVNAVPSLHSIFHALCFMAEEYVIHMREDLHYPTHMMILIVDHLQFCETHTLIDTQIRTGKRLVIMDRTGNFY